WSEVKQGKGRDVPVRLDSVWASSPTDVYAAGDPCVLLHFDGTKWSEIDIGARQVVVPTPTRSTAALVSPRVGPVWGTSAADVWVRKDVIRVDGRKGTWDHAVMHFDGKTWNETRVRLPAESEKNTGHNQVFPEVLALSPYAILTRFDNTVFAWDKDG